MQENNIKIPNHVAIILDGNGRWAKERGLSRSKGHLAGFDNLKKVADYIFSKGVKILSVYAFSTENFKRSKMEVDFLMNLFETKLLEYVDTLADKGIRIVFSGEKSAPLPKSVIKSMQIAEEKTINNTNGIFNICINYGGRREIVDACKKITNKVINNEISIDDITEELFDDNLYYQLDPVDLMIRTSGEIRISNFMLWQISYAELYFPKCYFPDFNEIEFDKALEEYTKRDRRYGSIKDE